MMQAITTKFLGPTNTKGQRVKATCAARSIIVSWDYGLNPDENHDAAAQELVRVMGWDKACYGHIVGGGLPDGSGNAYVFVRVR